MPELHSRIKCHLPIVGYDYKCFEYKNKKSYLHHYFVAKNDFFHFYYLCRPTYLYIYLYKKKA